MDYTTPQTIKFYRQVVEKLTGDAFDEMLLFTRLIKVHSRIPMLTIDGKLLTTSSFARSMQDSHAMYDYLCSVVRESSAQSHRVPALPFGRTFLCTRYIVRYLAVDTTYYIKLSRIRVSADLLDA